MRKNYNFQRKKLQLPEYGRHIHQMVDHILTIQDRDERNRQVKAVIAVMGNLNPLLRDSSEFAHKIWDHLFILADFKLDIDSPYPIPTAATLIPTPNKLKYPSKQVKIKHYGKNVEKVLLELQKSNNTEDAEIAVGNIAKYMRTKSYEYNQEHPSNEVIIKDIKKLSNNMTLANEDAISNLKSEYRNTQNTYLKVAQNRSKINKNQRPIGKTQYRQRPNPSK